MADNALSWLRHPRRFGFVIFNVIVIVLIVLWGIATSNPSGEEGIANLPTLLIGPAGTVFLIGLLIAGWIVWTLFVIWRRWMLSRRSNP